MSLEPSKSWPRIVRWFHWISAGLVLFLLIDGTIMVRVTDIGLRFELYQLHKSFGIIILTLTALRMLARFLFASSNPTTGEQGWRFFAASTVHALLYTLVVGVVFSGWIMVSASPIPVPISLFGFFNFPTLTPRNFETYVLAKAWHGWLTKALLILSFLHITAALKHHFIDRDDVLKRMLNPKKLPRNMSEGG
jgi:cytochrome b561